MKNPKIVTMPLDDLLTVNPSLNFGNQSSVSKQNFGIFFSASFFFKKTNKTESKQSLFLKNQKKMSFQQGGFQQPAFQQGGFQQGGFQQPQIEDPLGKRGQLFSFSFSFFTSLISKLPFFSLFIISEAWKGLVSFKNRLAKKPI